jgi:multidrug efflux system outer membrane protein
MTWNIFAQLLQPIFEGGRNTARVEMRESQQRQALFAYERALLQALREVEDSLIGLRQVGLQKASLTERVTAAQKVVDLAELRYKGGVSTYLEVLDAQRTLFDAQTSETNAKSEHIKVLIRLYKALGGGWPADHATQTAPGAAPSAAPGAPPPAAPTDSKG